MPNQLAVQPTQRKVSGMSNWFILQPNVVLYKVHTWELHYQVSKYESWFYTRMLSWGEWDFVSNMISTMPSIPDHLPRPWSSTGWKEKGSVLPEHNSLTEKVRFEARIQPDTSHPPYSCCQYLCAQGCRIRLSSWAGFRPQLSSNCCRQRFYYLKTRSSFWTVYVQSCQAESLQLWTVGI